MDHVRRLPIIAVIGSGDPDHGNPELAAAVGPNRAGLALGIIPRSPAVRLLRPRPRAGQLLSPEVPSTPEVAEEVVILTASRITGL